MRITRLLLLALIVAGMPPGVFSAPADEPPAIPVGADAYLMWDRWPYQRIGARAYMRSTFDRTGGNETADASHFLYQESNDFNVTLDTLGPGVLYFVRYNHWHGSPWHYEVDGSRHIVQETSTADPTDPVKGSVWMPEHLFPPPLTYTWSTTKGADLSWVPIPFARSFRMAYTRTHYGTGYYIYHLYMRGAKLSRPIVSWNGRTPPAQDMVDLVGRAGTDIAPRPGTPEGEAAGVRRAAGRLSLKPFQAKTVVTLDRAPAMVRALEFNVPEDAAMAFGRARLRITWDGRAQPSVDAPVGLFYGTGSLYNRSDKEYLVKSFPMVVRFHGGRAFLSCYFPMPFFRSARIELTNTERQAIGDIRWAVRTVPYKDPPNHVGWFHATYADHPKPQPGAALLLLDTKDTEGAAEWSGSFVGTSYIFSHRGVLNTLEGDPRFLFDDSDTPQAQGTGSEEWGGGGDYWGGRTMTLPFAGHPVGCSNPGEARNPEDLIQSAYRFLLGDLMPFGRRARIALEHGPVNNSEEHYETVTYWYGLPSPSLIRTDELVIGSGESEKSHGYRSPGASKPYEISSRYEWGPAHTPDGREVVFEQKKKARTTRTQSEFTMRLDPGNHGVLLRRCLDYAWPDQRADVYVANASHLESAAASASLAWDFAGTWYTPGSDMCVFSFPPHELGETQHVAQVSNRRFKDEEFLVPKALTRGRSAIRIRVVFRPVNRPLFPNYPRKEPAWSEITYRAYCYVMPRTAGW